jgi:hypothetical protein
MKLLKITLLTALILPFLITGCIEKPVGPVGTVQTVTITGKVLNVDNKDPIPNANVTLKKSLADTTLIDFAVTDSTGSYRLSFETNVSLSAVIVTVISGFSPDTLTVKVDPGKDFTQQIYLKEVLATGLPDQAHFTLTVDKGNFPGLVKLDATNTIRVRVGDKSGNPVVSGTRINFSTRGGTVDGSANTDLSGSAQAKLYGGNPVPVDPVYGRGFTWVKAFTFGENGKTVQDSALVLFSGQTKIVGPASGFTLGDGGTQTFQYSVVDSNGNPLTEGTGIDVTVTGSSDIKTTGDLSVTLGDTQAKGPETTSFSFTLIDTKPLDKNGNQPLSVTISVTSSNGNKSYTFTGTLLGSNVSGGTGTGAAATIAFIDASLNDISVREVGGNETTLLTFEARDSLGAAVDSSHRANVTFYISSGPGGGEYISPTSSITQSSTGRVQTTLSSGTKAGVVQIVAQTTVASRTIRSAPVIVNIFGGFPDQAHFSIGPAKLNFPGYDILNLTNTITVIAGDKYSNPVRPGTAVYFRTTGGTINVPSTAYTTDDGVAAATLRSGNPRPYDPILGAGFAYITASTVGESANTVKDSTVVLFSGISQIHGLSTTTFAVPAGGSSGPISFKVTDENGNPLSSGTVITLTLQYTAPPNTTINLAITGDINVTLGDVQVKGPGTTDFSFQVVDQTVGGVPTPIPVTVVISVTSPNGKPPNVSISGTVG